jgi:hypothetical protein
MRFCWEKRRFLQAPTNQIGEYPVNNYVAGLASKVELSSAFSQILAVWFASVACQPLSANTL